MPPTQYRCYAKVNLTLEIVGKRQDGYHDLASLVHTVSLADQLRIDSADTLQSQVEGLDLEVESNLVTRAARLLATTAHVEHGAELTLEKRIPAAAGLGGGSSDAATALVGLNRLWQTRLKSSELVRLGSELGSDVPFFLRGGAALMRGRGNRLQLLPALGGQWLLIVVPPHDLANKTSRLYAALRPTDFSNGDATMRAAQSLQRQQPLNPDDLVNAFTRAALLVFPGLEETWQSVERTCRRRFFLSGAGPALFALVASRADAHRQQARVSRLGVAAHAVRTVGRARALVSLAGGQSIGYP